MKKSLKAIVLFFVLFGCTSPPPEEVEERELRYGKLSVPENRQEENSRNIDIACAVVPAKKPSDRPPILFIQGGPGGSALQMVPFFQNNPLSQKHDIILFDARGTGESEANCKWLGAEFIKIMAQDMTLEEEFEQAIALCDRCKEELNEKGVDLAGYNSMENAADIEALRKHLEIDTWILFGGSYGTRLGFTYLREYEAAEAAVFMGVFPPEVNIYDGFIPGLAASINYLFEQCAGDTACNEKYPDLETLFATNINQLIEEPLTINFQGNDFVINAQDALLIIQQMLYQNGFIQQIPAFVKALETGDESVISSSITRTTQTINFINLATYWSVQAREEVQFNEANAVTNDLEEYSWLKPGLSFFSNDQQLLEQWHPFRSEEFENDQVVSETPILIVNGVYDPITPIANARKVADDLSNASLIEFPNDGHTVFNPCFFETFEAFVQGDYATPTVDCTADNEFTWR